MCIFETGILWQENIKIPDTVPVMETLMGISQYAYNPFRPLATTVPKLFRPGDDIVGVW